MGIICTIKDKSHLLVLIYNRIDIPPGQEDSFITNLVAFTGPVSVAISCQASSQGASQSDGENIFLVVELIRAALLALLGQLLSGPAHFADHLLKLLLI